MTPRALTRASLRQIESFKLNFRENARSRTDHGADIITWPAPGDSPSHPQRSVSLNDSLTSAGYPRCPLPPPPAGAGGQRHASRTQVMTLNPTSKHLTHVSFSYYA